MSTAETSFISAVSDDTAQARKTVKTACVGCRARKVACDGSRPKCKRCHRRGADCVFTTVNKGAIQNEALSRENEALRTEIGKLQDQVHILQSSKEGMTAASRRDSLYSDHRGSIASLTVGPRYVQQDPFNTNTWTTHLPNTRLSAEHELWSRHPTAYPPLFPFEQPQAVAEAILGRGSKAMDDHALQNIEGAWISSSCLYPEPKSYIDRLSDVNIGLWTDIPISNEYAATAIRMYLETEHPLIARFDSSLFVRDLIDGRGEHCSYLLVNALLCHAIVRFAHAHSGATEHSLAFFNKAKTLWGVQRNTCTVLAIPALQLLIYAGAMHGLDDDSQKFTDDCCELTRHSGLLDTAVAELPSPNGPDICDEMRSKAQIAWGYFVSASLWAFAYRWPLPDPPVSLPIPGSPGFSLPTGMGQTFTWVCRFWIIMEDAIRRYGDLDSSPEGRVPFYVTEHSYQRLVQWTHDLPRDCTRTDGSPHHVVIMHIWFHTAIVALTRPWLHTSEASRHLSSHTRTIGAIHKASLRQLKRLLLDFMMNYPESRYHVYWHIALIYVANDVLSSPTDKEWRFYFLVCLKGYLNLSSVYGFAPICFKGLLTIAMDKRMLSAHEAQRSLSQLAERQNSTNIHNTKKLSIRLATADIARLDVSLSADRLADELDRVALEHEWGR